MNVTEQAYYDALKLVQKIEQDLQTGIRHHRTKNGMLLHTLDQVVLAIIEDDLNDNHKYQPTRAGRRIVRHSTKRATG